MDRISPSKGWIIWCCLVLAGVAFVRLVLLDRLALTDNTESRYASIGWQMFHTGDAVTPMIYYGGTLQPFSGKPPLEFWLISLSYRLFGVSEWAARAPNFLIGIAMVAATGLFARRFWGTRAAVLAGIILSSSVLFFVLAGACVLDVPLAAGTTGAMIAFACFAEGVGWRRGWGLAFFLALDVGALAKGPIALVLAGLAIGLWLLVFRRWRLLWELPWFWGTILFFAVAAPWYYLAEKATPGFLHYFFINEHFLRYVSNDYGDRYGYGRKLPYGASWLLLAGSLLPWTALAVVAVTRALRRAAEGSSRHTPRAGLSGTRSAPATIMRALRHDPWLTFVLLWGLAPAVFFTLARQMLVTYLLPGLPGLAIATAVALEWWMESDAVLELRAWIKWHFLLPAMIAAAGIVLAAKSGSLLPWTVAALASVAVLGWLASASLRWGPAAGLAALGLATSMAFGAAMFLLAPSIGEKYSTKVVLSTIEANPATRDRPIVMPLGEAYSAEIYAKLIPRTPFEHRPDGGEGLLKALLERPGSEVLLFKRHDWEGLKPQFARRLAPIVQTPHWVACERRMQR